MNNDFDASKYSNLENIRQTYYKSEGKGTYLNALERIRSLVSRKVTNTVKSNEEESDTVNILQLSETELKRYIEQAITDNNISCEITSDVGLLTNYIYHDMAEYSFITREKIFEIEGFEELNIDAWDLIWIKVKGKYSKTEYSFSSPREAEGILLRMFQKTNTPFDKGMPFAVADLGNNIRITAYRTPVVEEDVGVAASIRKVTGSTISSEMLTQKTITDEMLLFLLLTAEHGISQCYAGETGSGKTTLAGFILGDVSQRRRTFTIEEGAREWDFRKYNDDFSVINSVVQTRTRLHDEKERNINQNRLLQGALRFDPDIIGVGEMRSDEAFAAIEASNIGHTVITTVHSSSALDSPVRLMTLAKKAFEFQDHTLMQVITSAFPLQIYLRTLSDGSRRVTEIVEILGYENGQIQHNKLFEFKAINNIKDPETGDVRIVGEFVKCNNISEKMHQTMILKGATLEELTPFYNN